MKYIANPAAEETAFELLSAGKSKEEARQALAVRFPGVKSGQRTHAVQLALVRLIDELDLRPAEEFLESAARSPDLLAEQHGQQRAEALVETVWGAVDALTGVDSDPCERIAGARKLDQLLSLGWRDRLPKGCL